MADDLLAMLDERFRAARSGTTALKIGAVAPIPVARDEAPAPGRVALRDRFPWLAAFICVQLLWGALLFIPGSQDYRPLVRALPYAASLGMAALYLPANLRMRGPRGTIWLLLALILLVANLLHPTSQLAAGIAQCVFQASIAAPMFWGWKAVASPERLRRLLWIALLCNSAGAALGVLQVYYPERFMPPQFSALGLRMNDMYVESLTYIGPNGERIVRPPGLSDQPGGAAATGALAVALGAGLSLCAQTPTASVLTLSSVALGLTAIYLTQVRSLLLMSVGALAVLAAILFRRGQIKLAGRIAATACVLVVGTFLWARSVGGESVERRFLGITQQGALRTYQENRGGFVNQTFGELLDQYPFGAGVGRWGMMNVYFGDPADLRASQIWVEIQATGWLIDGGVPMWVFYGSAIFLALITAYRAAVQRISRDLANLALVVFAFEVLVVGFGWAGPVFNTQLGLLFWFFTSALYGAARGVALPTVDRRAIVARGTP